VKWDLEAIAAACGGTPTGSVDITGVSTDTRSIGEGDLYVALRGETFDGHDFADRAMEAGAAGVLVEHGRLAEGSPGVEVDDTLAALRALAVRRREELTAQVVAITGSSGKTSTKDLAAAALQSPASPRSFNNEVGVPLTILSAPSDATHLVVEVGSRGRGDIALLAPAIRPDVAVITTAGSAHLETFGDHEGVLTAKWELVEALTPSGVAVLPAEDERMQDRRTGPVITFGEVPAADLFASGVQLDEMGRPRFELRHEGRTVVLDMVSSGRHQARNAAAAVAAAVVMGIGFETAAERVARASVSQWRMEVSTRRIPAGVITVVNDAYNANPDSMRSALETVAAMPARARIAVLGKMHELGAAEDEAHHAVGALAAALGFDVVVVGDDPGIATGAGAEAVSFEDVDSAAAHLGLVAGGGDVVLVKASRATGLEVIPDLLEAAS